MNVSCFCWKEMSYHVTWYTTWCCTCAENMHNMSQGVLLSGSWGTHRDTARKKRNVFLLLEAKLVNHMLERQTHSYYVIHLNRLPEVVIKRDKQDHMKPTNSVQYMSMFWNLHTVYGQIKSFLPNNYNFWRKNKCRRTKSNKLSETSEGRNLISHLLTEGGRICEAAQMNTVRGLKHYRSI